MVALIDEGVIILNKLTTGNITQSLPEIYITVCMPYSMINEVTINSTKYVSRNSVPGKTSAYGPIGI